MSLDVVGKRCFLSIYWLIFFSCDCRG